jgi:uncharacterized protein
MSDRFKKFGKINTLMLVVFFSAFAIVKLLELRFPTAVVRLKDERLTVLVARNMYQLKKGLGGRESLRPFDGMLFVFPAYAKQRIVMRDMRFPIDIVWISQGKVVDIAKQIQPEGDVSEATLTRYTPRVNANAVVELPAGWADTHGLRIGDALVVVHE